MLEDYFIETSEYLRTLRGLTRLVTGRKGTGKTAIFFRVRDVLRSKKENIVLDLKPESHQLSRFRSELMSISTLGVFDHTLYAFLYFVILSEVLIKIKQQLMQRAKVDGRALEKLNEIDSILTSFAIEESGDFTSRLNRLAHDVLQHIRRITNEGRKFSPERLTNFVFQDKASRLRSIILGATSSKEKIVILFDNLDKGWPADGVSDFDVRSVPLLMASLERIRRDLGTRSRECWSVTFLRNDVYELLVAQTPDRGKTARVSIDWTDRAKLRQMISSRLRNNAPTSTGDFTELWESYVTPKVHGQDSLDYFVDYCLMRPRFLIDIIENAIAHAINRGNALVEEKDCEDAVKQHASSLLSDFGYEIGDVSSITSDLFYGFIGHGQVLSEDEVIGCLKSVDVHNDHLDKAINLMLWYGALGLVGNSDAGKYIYDYQYDMKRLDVERKNALNAVRFIINPALFVALSD